MMIKSMRGQTRDLRLDLQVVAHSTLPDGHALRLGVEPGAGVRYSLARCKKHSHNIGYEHLKCREQRRSLQECLGVMRDGAVPCSLADGWFWERNV